MEGNKRANKKLYCFELNKAEKDKLIQVLTIIANNRGNILVVMRFI